MKRLVGFATILIVALVLVVSCSDNGADGGGGTLTVSVSGISGHDGDVLLFGVFAENADLQNDDPVAYGEQTIASGAASATALDNTTDQTWTGSGGVTYDLYVFIDGNGNEEPDNGEDAVNGLATAEKITIDGDQTANFTDTDFSPI